MKRMLNFLPEQYRITNALDINHNYLLQQFADHDQILTKIKEVVVRGDFTLGQEVDLFEEEFASLSGARHAIGVGSGTDALFLSLKALGIGPGDEVITTPYTFYATIGAIITAGARPVFVDIDESLNIDSSRIEAAITSNTRAIMPVHWTGNPCEMSEIEAIATKYNIYIVSDACHAINALYRGRPSGTLGTVACFSLHPLKNLNVWGDGGIITTDSDTLANQLRLMRNHGLAGRDECIMFAYNSRLDTIQAVVARHLLKKISHITESRIAKALYLDEQLRSIRQIQIPRRDTYKRAVYHLYMINCEARDELQNYLITKGIDAKVHYRIPMHLQKAAHHLNYKVGDFPLTEKAAKNTLSLPVHEFISREQLDKIITEIKSFYA